MKTKQLTLSDLKQVRGGIALGKKRTAMALPAQNGKPACKCHVESAEAAPADS
ncbi:MAG: hypothetical protein AAF799_03095 [Myxococcota bacterium]